MNQTILLSTKETTPQSYQFSGDNIRNKAASYKSVSVWPLTSHPTHQDVQTMLGTPGEVRINSCVTFSRGLLRMDTLVFGRSAKTCIHQFFTGTGFRLFSLFFYFWLIFFLFSFLFLFFVTKCLSLLSNSEIKRQFLRELSRTPYEIELICTIFIIIGSQLPGAVCIGRDLYPELHWRSPK